MTEKLAGPWGLPVINSKESGCRFSVKESSESWNAPGFDASLNLIFRLCKSQLNVCFAPVVGTLPTNAAVGRDCLLEKDVAGSAAPVSSLH